MGKETPFPLHSGAYFSANISHLLPCCNEFFMHFLNVKMMVLFEHFIGFKLPCHTKLGLRFAHRVPNKHLFFRIQGRILILNFTRASMLKWFLHSLLQCKIVASV